MAITPQEAIEQADDAFNRGDIDALLSYYDENAVWVVKPGDIVSGKPALQKQFEEILRITPQVIKEKDHVIECDDIALCTIKWRMVGTDSDGSQLDTGGFASTVLHKQTDGHWRIVIDNPWGPAILETNGQAM